MSSLAGTKSGVHPIWKYSIPLLVAALVAFLFVKMGMLIYIAVLAIPAVAWGMVLMYRNPKITMYGVLFISFVISFLVRYVPGIPYSIFLDVFLILALIIPAIKHWHHTNFRLAKRSVTLALGIWMMYVILQIFNPLAVTMEAWFYSMRPNALYPLLTVVTFMILFNTRKDFERFLIIWLGFSLLGVFWGIKQNIFGVSHVEQMWLEAGAKGTHVLFGRLRVFSYYFDAGTFGTAMGQVAVACLIMAFGPFAKKRRTIFLVLGILFIYAMMISGTRGAIAVPAAGGVLYLIMIRKIKLILLGLLVMGFSFSFLKFTSIGASNYTINRMRTSLNPEDASLNTRMRNRALLTEYLKDKPFGGGMGTAGSWGRRFSSDTWLANFEPDGMYTWIRAETGIVGRNLYVSIMVFILLRGMVIASRLKNKAHQTYAIALLAGFAGILLANYGNPVINQFPNLTLNFIVVSFVFTMKYWNDDGIPELPGEVTPVEGGTPEKDRLHS